MNRGIDRPTDSILFDEKMGGTVHRAPGRAYEACLSAGDSGIESAVQVNLITDLRAGGALVSDGDVVKHEGVFRWDSGFAG